MTTYPPNQSFDVVVVGGGNAGFSAASTAAQILSASSSSSTPPSVLLIEKAPFASKGGNTFYTAGAYRYCFSSIDDLKPLLDPEQKITQSSTSSPSSSVSSSTPSANGQLNTVDDTNDDGSVRQTSSKQGDVRSENPKTMSIFSKIDITPYTQADFTSDLMRVTKNKSNPRLAQILVSRSREAVGWMAKNGGLFELSFHRQAYEVDGRWKFWGGMVTCFKDGGKGLVDWHLRLAEEEGVQVWWESPAVGLLLEEDDGSQKDKTSSETNSGKRKVIGVEVLKNGNERTKIYARGGIILACGGFQANADLRAQWLGPGWDQAHVRGCEFSTGDGHHMASSIGAKMSGQYTGCHSTCWDAASPRSGGNRQLTNQYTKSGYPLGLMLNLDGKRFVDEGFDLRNYTYAVFGAEVLKQPSGRVFQVWDAEGSKWLRKEEYADDVTTNIRANTLDELADKLVQRAGLRNKTQFLNTITEYNEAVASFRAENPHLRFDPATKDGLSTQSSSRKLDLPKSNWARELKTPPFTAVEITSGVTFTFGGLEIVPETAQVVSSSYTSVSADQEPIEGLYCCGELLGDLFHENYPGGSGLTAGTVFGRIAGEHAANRAVTGLKG